MISTQSLERATICASAPGWATPTIAAEVDGPSRMLAGAVTRMKAAGANLTDEQVPVVAEYLTRAASNLTVAAVILARQRLRK